MTSVDPAELLKAANYALRKQSDPDRAMSIAQLIISDHPDSSEARYAKKLLREIAGEPESDEPDVGDTFTYVRLPDDEIARVKGSVTITDVDISFSNMVGLLVKFAFAVIPAALIIGLIWLAITMIFGQMIQR